MFELKQIDSESQLQRWLWENPEQLALQEDKSGLTLTIEMEVGLQITIWASDYDVLIEGINNLAPKPPVVIKAKTLKPRKFISKADKEAVPTKIIERAVEVQTDKIVFVHVAVPLGAKPGQGYMVDGEGFKSYRKIEYDPKTKKFEEKSA